MLFSLQNAIDQAKRSVNGAPRPGEAVPVSLADTKMSQKYLFLVIEPAKNNLKVTLLQVFDRVFE